ncbi:MAG: HDOD domain-containing protein [Candidatus Gastranaerophilales bacterium]|nr:HDOD domain-containing protein [Candidatus Gastranaerophilales bacterium]
MKKAVGYISATGKHEIEREIEIKVQIEHIADFCEKNNMEFLQNFIEPKESTEDYKSELFKLLDEAGSGKFTDVIVLNLDRMAPDNIAKAWIIDELKKKGVRLHSLTEELLMGVEFSDEKIKIKAEKIKQKVRDIPSLPEIVNKVVALIQNPNSSALQLSNVISQDAGLTSRVLRLVNSAYYGFPKQISSIQHSIAILGFTTIRGLVLSSSIFKIFAPKMEQSKMLDYKQLWKHSLLCAIAAKNINKYLHKNYEEHIFSAAILHDMGKIILDQYDHPNYVLALSEFDYSDMNNNLVIEKKYCGLDHCEVGALITTHWNLPEAISQTVQYHHNPFEADEEHRELVSVIAIGNVFAHVLASNINLENEYFDPNILTILGINHGDISRIYCLINEDLPEIHELEGFFQ